MNQMVVSYPRADSLMIIDLHTINKLRNINPPDILESMNLLQIDKILTQNTHKLYFNWSHEPKI